MSATPLTLSAICAAAMLLTACTDQVGLAHGDPGRTTTAQTPLVGASPDSANATLASANGAPLSQASNATPLSAAPPNPLPQSTLQPSLPAANAATAEARAAARGGAFSAVTVTFADHALEKSASDPRLVPGAVALAVEQELSQHQLWAPGSSGPVLAIAVDDFTSSLASNATVLGYTFRNVMLVGAVSVPGPAARPPFDVHARARLTTRDDTGKSGSLGPLFARFAQLVVADVRGVEAPQEPMPR